MRVDLKNKAIDRINIEKPINVSNICVSSNNKYLAFINHQNYETDSLAKDYLMIYDLITSKIQYIDSANQSKDEWFGSVDDHSGLLWNGDHELLYYKHNKIDRIYGFNVTTLKSYKIIDIPFDRVNNFAFYNGDFYSVSNGQIQRFNNKGLMNTEFKVQYKFDYLRLILI